VNLALTPLCTIESLLTEPAVVGKGAGVIQERYQVLYATLTGTRLNGTMQGRSDWDWMSSPSGVGTLTVRAVITTHDGATISVRYTARSDITHGVGTAPGYAAPVFSTTSPDYLWLNFVQGVGRGTLVGDHIHWDWYVVSDTP